MLVTLSFFSPAIAAVVAILMSILAVIYVAAAVIYSKPVQRLFKDLWGLAKSVGGKIKEADRSPLEKEKPGSAFGLVFAFTYIYSMGLYSALYGVFMLFMACFDKDLSFAKQAAVLAVGVIMFVAARFMKVQGDKALHEFRNR